MALPADQEGGPQVKRLAAAILGALMVGSMPTALADHPDPVPCQEDAEAPCVRLDDGIEFHPLSITIAAGETVTWFHSGNTTPHSVTSGADRTPDGRFDYPEGCDASSFDQAVLTCWTGTSPRRPNFPYTFAQAGTYQYFCKVHSTMNGTVVVESSSSDGGGGGNNNSGGNGGGQPSPPPQISPSPSPTASPSPTPTLEITASPGKPLDLESPVGTEGDEGDLVAQEDDSDDGGGVNAFLVVLALIGLAAGAGFAWYRLRSSR